MVPTHKQHPKNAQHAASLALGERVRLWRISRGLTQGALELKAGLAHNALSRIETGTVLPRLETIERLGEALGVGLEELQFASPPKNQASEKYGDLSTHALVKRMTELSEERLHSVLRIMHTILDELDR